MKNPPSADLAASYRPEAPSMSGRPGSSSPSVPRYQVHGFNRFGMVALYAGDRQFLQLKVAPATAQLYSRLLHNEDFQAELLQVRKAGRITPKWLQPRLQAYQKSCQDLHRVGDGVDAKQSWGPTEVVRPKAARSKHAPPRLEQPQDQQKYAEALCRASVPQLEMQARDCLERIKRDMERKFPAARQRAVHRQFKLPVDALWMDLIEWLVHWGEVPLVESGAWPTPHCSLWFIGKARQQRLAIEVFRSTTPSDVRRLFEEGDIKVKKFLQKFPRQFRRVPSEKPEYVPVGTGEDVRGFIVLGRKFNRDDILSRRGWPKVRQLQARLPGGKAPRCGKYLSQMVEAVKLKTTKPSMRYQEIIAKLEMVANSNEALSESALRKRMQRLKGRGKNCNA